MSLRPGLYDLTVTVAVERELEALAEELVRVDPSDEGSSAEALARVVHERLVHVLRALPAKQRVPAQVALVNELLARLQAATEGVVLEGDHVAPPARTLRAVLAAVEPPARPRLPPSPSLALSASGLLVNGRHDLSIGPELKKEIASADRVDLLCSFLKWSGFRLVEAELRELCARGALRVLTTAYMGATERRVLDRLVEIGARLRVSYETDRTRLHAKAWMFHRASGFSTAAIGSSNLSHAALLDGAEWNVRVSQVDNPAILEKFHATFEQYWEDPAFGPYDPEAFSAAVRRIRRDALAPYLSIDVAPRPHQREILDALEAERSRGHRKNLVVAATGTGKTVVAALDYAALRRTLPRDRLLFVAHRREILDQSLATFRTVVRDGAFGESLHSGDRPDRYEHVFASIQALDEGRLDTIPVDHFDVVIVDEFHHARAPTYERLLAHVKPRVLLGLTATPERADGKSVLPYFDGRVAAELRLWKALDQELLSPFQYFGVGGAPDVSGVKWSGGRYDARELSRVYTADHLFAKRVLAETAAKVADVQQMRALGFCVDVAHAEFMAARFAEAGIEARAVSARSSKEERRSALAALRHGDLRVVFSVDLFNEGVDLPDVDTLLFLRPTESATVFLQQLGRGLRLSRDKACCTVLDFIGGAHRRFRFDARFRALLGGTRRGIERQIEEGFPRLPSGCFIELDRVAQRVVLENVRATVGRGRGALVDDLRELLRERGEVTLGEYLEATGFELEDVYDTAGTSWTELHRRVGRGPAPPEDSIEAEAVERIERALPRMLHIDDPARLEGFAALLAKASSPLAEVSEGAVGIVGEVREVGESAPRRGVPGAKVRPTMLEADATETLERQLHVLLTAGEPFAEMQATWDRLARHPWLGAELRQMLDVLADRNRRVSHDDGGVLRTHATYSRFEIFAAYDERTKKGGVKKTQTGVYYLERARTDLFFVTLHKTERGFTSSTMYRDYPISPTRFHWESQSSCHEGTPTGRRYLRIGHGADHALLFVRERQQDERGHAMPYVNLGPVRYRGHEGERPMRIEWTLDRPMPAALFQEAKLAAG